MRSKALAAALVVALLAALLGVLYAAAGYWLGPRVVRGALMEHAQRLGLGLEIGELRTDPFDLAVTLENAKLRTGERELARVRRLSADLTWSSLWGDAWVAQQVTLLDPVFDLRGGIPAFSSTDQARSAPPVVTVRDLHLEGGTVQFAHGSKNMQVEGLELRATGLSTAPGQTGRYELAARLGGGQIGSQGSITLHPLTLREATVEGAGIVYSGVELPSVQLRLPLVALSTDQPFEVSGRATIAPRGKVSVAGRVTVRPLGADLEVSAADVPLAQAGRFLPGDLQVVISSGTATASGRARVDRQQAGFDGAVSVSDARFEERQSGQLLLAWKELATEQAALTFAPFRAELGEVTARAPSGRLVIEEDGRLNSARVFSGAEQKEGPQESERPRVSVRQLRIEQGTLDFVDRSLESDFAVTVRELEGSITGLSTGPGDPARVQLEGRVAQFGSARIRGSIDLQSPKSLTNVSARLRNVPLAELTPYVVRFAGYRVQAGRLSADLRYRVRDARLVGDNRLTFEELQLGERVRQPRAADLPLELAVAVLADSQGRIRLDIPVRGNLNDPQFDFGGLVGQALRNVIGRIASAPFRALAAALGGGGEELDRVRFEPGRAELTPPAEEAVARVARALAERPALSVTIQGGYDAQRDLRAMRLAHVRREVARRAGADPGMPLDFGDPKVLQAAERLYLERAGSRPQMLELRQREPRYGRALVDAVAEATPADEEAAQILARARAEMVRAGLFAHGLDPARVTVGEPARRDADKDGVATTLALDTARGAAAGASAQ